MTETIGKLSDKKNRTHLVDLFFSRLDFSQLPENIKNYIDRLQEQNSRYETDVQSLQTQLSNLTAVVDFADSTKIAEIADLKQRHQQELETIHILMEGRRLTAVKSICLTKFFF